ncbi:MAG: P1 family peptidase, partial [Actinomycetota bacterium]
MEEQRTPRPREAGIAIGRLPTGPLNAITDVPGVRVGHATVWRDEPDPPAGRGVARTGVTVVVPA